MIFCVQPAECELEIKRSKFIASSYGIDSRDDVKAIMIGLRKKHPDARHVCYGYIADEKGDEFGYDDDGEPSGTAGKPIYSALAAADARKTLIAVVRYFGGIKLGAGGLTRAYRQSAAGLIEKAGLARVEKYGVYFIENTNAEYKKAAALLRSNGCLTEGIVYAETVNCTVYAPIPCDVAKMLEPLGTSVKKLGEKYLPTDEAL